jgi:hypothetical protein
MVFVEYCQTIRMKVAELVFGSGIIERLNLSSFINVI